MSILDNIRADAEKSSSNKGKIFYIKAGERKRIRFLSDLEDAMEIMFHSNYQSQISIPCQELFGRECSYCEDPEIKTRKMYIWTVWDYDANETKLFMYAMNNCSPVGMVTEAFVNYGTITDRDYMISVTGEGTNRTFSVMPVGEKQKLRNSKAKPYTKKEIIKMLDAAYPDKNSGYTKSGDTYTRTDKADDGFMNAPEQDYSEMTPKQLYDLCDERGIEAEPRMKQKYYINLLEEYDEEHASGDGWGEDEPEEQDYSGMTARELFKLCKERGISVEQKKPEKYYINLLKENDKAKDDWGDEDGDEWEEELPFN